MVSDTPPKHWQATLSVDATPAVRELLTAFGRPAVGVPGDLEAVQTWVERAADDLPRRIQTTLTGEVDGPQAALFARRYSAVGQLLKQLEAPEAWLLRAGLVCRTAEVLVGPSPRALRVRAVADFYYSQGARALHATRHPPRSMAALVDDLCWSVVARGVAHAQLTGPGPAGPVSINLLRVHGRRLHALDLRGADDLPDAISAHGGVAGTSGGFFLYSEPDIAPPCRRTDPVGLLVTDGVVRSVPWFRRAAIVQHDDGRFALRRIGPEGCTVRIGDQAWTIAARNRACEQGPVLYTRAYGERAPEPGLVLAGRESLGRGTSIPLLGGVLVGVDADVRGPAVWSLPDPTIRDAMAGGPLLFGRAHARELEHEDFAGSAPPVTFSRDETYDQNLLPRLGAGLLADGGLVLAAIDGRDLHRAPGFTLRMTADLLHGVGCTVAVNLDGGSSKRMFVAGRQVDLASTEVRTKGGPAARVRPVHTALIIGRESS